MSVELENRLSLAVRKVYKENAVEAMVGMLSFVATESQLEYIVNKLEAIE